MIPKLSVVMAVYNAENYLKNSIESVLSQTFTDYELIIINDCSTDGSLEILSKYNLPNVKLLCNKYNEGVPFSRNKAFLECSGEYIAIQDADDISLPYRFEKEVNYLDTHKDVTITGSHAIRIDNNGTFLGYMSYPPEHTNDAFRVIKHFKLNPIIDPSSMFRRSPILDIGAYRMEPELKTVQDFDLWCRLLINGHKLYNFQEPLIKYRINPQGITRLKKQEQVHATDVVWAAFQQKNFPKVVLRTECFIEDSEFELLNN